jgi:hypothetical protein
MSLAALDDSNALPDNRQLNPKDFRSQTKRRRQPGRVLSIL